MSQCGRRHAVGVKRTIIVCSPPGRDCPSSWASRVPRFGSIKSGSWTLAARRRCRRADIGGARPRRTLLGYDTGTSAEAIMTNDLLESVKDGVAVLTLNRPDRLNAMSGPMLDALLEALPRLAADAAVGVVVLTGAGRGFCAGGDVKAMAEGREFAETSLEEKAHGLRSKMEVSRLLHEMPKPTIAMVRGAAAGAGLSMALACDLRVAGESAKFATAFARVGYSGDFGGSWFLTQLVGTAKARELSYAAEIVDARHALALGIVNRVVPDEKLEDEAMHHTRTGFTEDHKEAARAFVEKREPVFKGR